MLSPSQHHGAADPNGRHPLTPARVAVTRETQGNLGGGEGVGGAPCAGSSAEGPRDRTARAPSAPTLGRAPSPEGTSPCHVHCRTVHTQAWGHLCLSARVCVCATSSDLENKAAFRGNTAGWEGSRPSGRSQTNRCCPALTWGTREEAARLRGQGAGPLPEAGARRSRERPAKGHSVPARR